MIYINTHYFKQAKEEMLKADYCGNARIGAVAVYKGSIIAKGHNSDSTSPLQKKYNVHRYKNTGNRWLPDKIHAETMCIQKIRWLDIDFSKVSIYIYRELKNGDKAISAPCNSCYAMFVEMGIKNVYYINERGNYIHEKIH